MYWWLHSLVRRRTLDFLVNERQAQLQVPDDVEIRCSGVEAEDLAARMAELRGQDPEEHRGRLRAGHFVVYAIGRDGELQSWGWATAPVGAPQDAPWESGIRMRVHPGTGFMWDFFTLPAYRGRGLYKLLLRRSAEQCFVRGAKRAWGYAEVSNTASRRGIMGADYAGRAGIQLNRYGPFCRVTSPGFSRIVRIGGVVDMDALLPPGGG
jgi:GNAT superfamily N-acetyltransferase